MTRSYQKELLDGNDISFKDIRQNMRELDFINTYLGGHAITLKGFQQLLQNKKSIHVCEIGCGGGDNLLAIYKWCNKNDVAIKMTGIDINPDCISIARQTLPAAVTSFITADYQTVDFGSAKPDIVFSSLFCHHFTEEELRFMLLWMDNNATSGFFINDLHRHFLAYYSIKILTQIFSKSYLVKHDAPLSVKRGFVKGDWENLLQHAVAGKFNITWKWAFRWLIVSQH
ncbi:MAG: methyltransferase domain-containing protein [Chitinophagaceae bacterium]